MYRVITHASEILTGQGIREKDGRRPLEADLGRIEDGALVYRVLKSGPGRVEWVGPTSELPKRFRKLRARSLRGKQALIPGLVDCHTHLLFAGDRSDEFAARCGGATYQEIAARGGGIMSTVRATRAASAAELERLGVARLREARAYGVRTLEIKSGYGLDTESELKLLSSHSAAAQAVPGHDFDGDLSGRA